MDFFPTQQRHKLLLLPVVLLCLALLLAQSTVQGHRLRRHRHHHHHHERLVQAVDHFIVKNALTECRVAVHCRSSVERALLNQEKVPQCDGADYFDMLKCLDREIMSRTNVTELNSRSGRICCLEIEEVDRRCRDACSSALFSPTLSHEMKQKRIEIVCNGKHGDGIQGDSGLLNCLATTGDWLSQKHKVMM